ncbi:hypothetical protein MLD38_005770 [Melastoma candidum]|uniref:Uncharacterized protein n=1 Tax=Melastoma candidum TaxID=119954 RepID=A0ACB9RKU2_9MYRT|nr:hypothetical protein MLD38_005770 [Melastoma candidum]
MSPARAWFLAMAIFVACYPSLTEATTYTVGDAFGWAVPSNTSYYQTWAADKTFVVGDVLNFTWTGTHDVADNISKADYDACTKVGTVLGSPVLIKLETNGSQYYICTVGPHCSLGQKLAITVMASTTNSTTPSPSAVAPSAATSTSKSIDLLNLAVLLFVLFG